MSCKPSNKRMGKCEKHVTNLGRQARAHALIVCTGDMAACALYVRGPLNMKDVNNGTFVGRRVSCIGNLCTPVFVKALACVNHLEIKNTATTVRGVGKSY